MASGLSRLISAALSNSSPAVSTKPYQRRLVARILSSRHCAHRSIASSSLSKNWRNETPDGGLTAYYVYTEDNKRVPHIGLGGAISPVVWPDQQLGPLADLDYHYKLPGNIGLSESCLNEDCEIEEQARTQVKNENRSHRSDLFTRATNEENQAQALYSAYDFIQFTPEAEQVLCTGLLEEFPPLMIRQVEGLVVQVHDCPQLFKREVAPLFPDQHFVTKTAPNPNSPLAVSLTASTGVTTEAPLSVITFAFKTVNDMSAWSMEMEEEREKFTEAFFATAKEIVARFKDLGLWADFIDPSSGTAYYGKRNGTHALAETNENYRLLGFVIEDLGCCKVISHREFGSRVFVGTIFAKADTRDSTLFSILDELDLTENIKNANL